MQYRDTQRGLDNLSCYHTSTYGTNLVQFQGHLDQDQDFNFLHRHSQTDGEG